MNLIGEVSSGKSSSLNAIADGIISNASMQREIINPEIYEFDNIGKAFHSFKKMATFLEIKHITNKQFDKNTTKIGDPKIICDNTGDKIVFKSQFGLGKFNIYDFPGLNDSKDSSEIFFGSIKDNINKCDCLLYVTKADSAFVNQSEVTGFKRIIDMCHEYYKQSGKLIKVCIIINEFDEDPDYSVNEEVLKYIRIRNELFND